MSISSLIYSWSKITWKVDRVCDYKSILSNFRDLFRLPFEFILGDLNLSKVLVRLKLPLCTIGVILTAMLSLNLISLIWFKLNFYSRSNLIYFLIYCYILFNHHRNTNPLSIWMGVDISFIHHIGLYRIFHIDISRIVI